MKERPKIMGLLCLAVTTGEPLAICLVWPDGKPGTGLVLRYPPGSAELRKRCQAAPVVWRFEAVDYDWHGVNMCEYESAVRAVEVGTLDAILFAIQAGAIRPDVIAEMRAHGTAEERQAAYAKKCHEHGTADEDVHVAEASLTAQSKAVGLDSCGVPLFSLN